MSRRLAVWGFYLLIVVIFLFYMYYVLLTALDSVIITPTETPAAQLTSPTPRPTFVLVPTASVTPQNE